MTRRFSTMAVAALVVIMTTACGTGAGLGDILGGGNPRTASDELRGRVDYVDTSSRYVVLTNVSGYNNMLSNTRSGDTVRIYYDQRTPVEYQGQTYSPADLEHGDEIAVRVDQSGNNLVARSMTVLYDSTSGSSYPGGGSYPSSGGYDSTIRGTVRHVDTSRRTIEIDRGGYGSTTMLEFDANTEVLFNGRTYRMQDLERGDEIEIRTRDIGRGRLLAQDVTVIRSVSGSGGGGGTYGSQYSTIRGTVRYVDANRREISLEQTSWISGFDRGAGRGSSVVIRYDSNIGVEYNGQMYSPTSLERGDIIDVDVQSSTGSTFLAHRITVVRDVNIR